MSVLLRLDQVCILNQGKPLLELIDLATNQCAQVHEGRDFYLLKNSHPESQTERHVREPMSAIYLAMNFVRLFSLV